MRKSKMAGLWKCIVGPRLTRIYREIGVEGRVYKPNFMEVWGDGVLKTLGIVWTVTLYTSPLIVPILYRKSYLTRIKFLALIKYSVIVGFIVVGSFLLRGLGRYTNPDYTNFLHALSGAKLNLSHNSKKQLSRYDFSFWAWPVEFRASQVVGDDSKTGRYTTARHSKRMGVVETIKTLPCQILSYAIAHTIGRRLLYPGSLQLFQSAVGLHLTHGRMRFIEEFNGERFKLRTLDENDIDAMFIDRRNKFEFANGNILVICCEGNAGFYEMGIMDTPINAQYSVLGWNHPGFGGSTGEPFPNQEENAIDVVIQFAIHQLGFKLENIVLYAWSIGGYTATWAAVQYPEIHGLVLDATFDDLLPLAVEQMPRSWKPLVVRTVRDHLNLNNMEQLMKYNGLVLLVRRLKDEVITSGDSNNLSANRGNFLLLKLLQTRYPNVFNEATLPLLQRWLTSDRNEQSLIWSEYNVNDDMCQTLASNCIVEEYGVFPSILGDGMEDDMKFQLALFLASKYMIDFDATHCQPLPGDLFTLPWMPQEVR